MSDDTIRAILARSAAQMNALEGIREFFALLDIVEESGSGREFHPNTISSCRANDLPRIEAALEKMRGVL